MPSCASWHSFRMALCGYEHTKSGKPCSNQLGPTGRCGAPGHPPRGSTNADHTAAAVTSAREAATAAANDSTDDAELKWRKTRAGTERGSGRYTGHLTRYGTECGRFAVDKDDERAGYGNYWAYYEDGERGAKFSKLKDAKAHCEDASRSGGVIQEIGKGISRLEAERLEQRSPALESLPRISEMIRIFEDVEAEIRQIDFGSNAAHSEVAVVIDRRIERVRSGEEVESSNWEWGWNARTGREQRVYGPNENHPKTNDEAIRFYEEQLTDLRDRISDVIRTGRPANVDSDEIIMERNGRTIR